MYHGDPEFRTHHCTGGGRVDITDNDDPIRAVLQTDLLIGDHDITGLLCVRSAADSQMDIRLRDTEVFENRIGHVAVVMLTGVYKDWLCPIRSCKQVIERCDFHEVRSGCSNQVNSYRLHRCSVAVT